MEQPEFSKDKATFKEIGDLFIKGITALEVIFNNCHDMGVIMDYTDEYHLTRMLKELIWYYHMDMNTFLRICSITEENYDENKEFLSNMPSAVIGLYIS